MDMVWVYCIQTYGYIVVVRVIQVERERVLWLCLRKPALCMLQTERQASDHMQFNLVAKTDFYDVTDLESAFLRLSSPVDLHVVMYVWYRRYL